MVKRLLPHQILAFITRGKCLCDYSDAYILAKGNISVNNTAGAGAAANNTNKKVIFKKCALFTNCLSKINNTQIDNAE